MNREILFRGKPDWCRDGISIDEDYVKLHAGGVYKDGWVYGQLARNAYRMVWIIGPIIEWDEDYIYPIYPGYWIPVDPKTVGQYTGTDIFSKGFKGVYVGDLFQDESGTVLEVIFEDKIGAFGAWRKEGEWLSMQLLKMCCELVGNKWDNPELLEVVEERET